MKTAILVLLLSFTCARFVKDKDSKKWTAIKHNGYQFEIQPMKESNNKNQHNYISFQLKLKSEEPIDNVKIEIGFVSGGAWNFDWDDNKTWVVPFEGEY